METPDTIVVSVENLPALMAAALVGAVLLFALGAGVRAWGMRMQRKGASVGAIDLAALRRMRDSGEISAEEFDRVCGTISGTPAAKKAPVLPGDDIAGEPPPEC
jgi:hypothetical protein